MKDKTLLPLNSEPFERNLETAISRATEVPVELGNLWDPTTCPADLLPWLAWSLSIDNWDINWSELNKRKKIQKAIEVHRYKGTVGAVKRALKPLGVTLDFIEWFQDSDDLSIAPAIGKDTKIKPNKFIFIVWSDRQPHISKEINIDKSTYYKVKLALDTENPEQPPYKLYSLNRTQNSSFKVKDTNISTLFGQLWNSATCPADLLPWLAWSLSIDNWDISWSEQNKRKKIQKAIEVHRYKETVGDVKRTLELLGITLDFIKLFQDSDDICIAPAVGKHNKVKPNKFIFIIWSDRQPYTSKEISLDEDTYDKIQQAIDKVNPEKNEYKLYSINKTQNSSFNIEINPSISISANISDLFGQLWSPATCPADLLPWLAWSLSLDNWDVNWSVQNKRKKVQKAIEVHRYKGTVGAVKRALKPLGVTLDFIEWFQDSDDLSIAPIFDRHDLRKPHTFILIAWANENPYTSHETFLNPKLYQTIKQTIDKVKPERSQYQLYTGARLYNSLLAGCASSGWQQVRRNSCNLQVENSSYKNSLSAIFHLNKRPMSVARYYSFLE